MKLCCEELGREVEKMVMIHERDDVNVEARKRKNR